MSSFYKDELFLNCRALDIETTGIDPMENEIMEWGIVPFHDSDPIQKLHGIDGDLLPEISAVTHLIPSDIAGLPLFNTDTASELVDIVEKNIMVCHNTRFEHAMLLAYGINITRSICTLRMARKLYGHLSCHKLTYLRYALNLDVNRALIPHRAVPDSIVTCELFRVMVDKMENDGILDTSCDYYEQIDAWLSEPIWVKEMPFGKHKGKPLEHVPLDYWDWALGNLETLDESSPNYDPDFAQSVFRAVEQQLR